MSKTAEHENEIAEDTKNNNGLHPIKGNLPIIQIKLKCIQKIIILQFRKNIQVSTLRFHDLL